MPLSSYNRQQLKKLIVAEEEHRAPHDRYVEMIKNRILLKELETKGATILITNSLGVEGRDQNGLKDVSVESLKKIIVEHEGARKLSIHKEKFMRYAHNGDKKKATKSHKKLMEMWMANHEILEEAEKRGEKSALYIGISGDGEEDEPSEHRDGGAYIRHAEEMKKSYEWRVEVLDAM